MEKGYWKTIEQIGQEAKLTPEFDKELPEGMSRREFLRLMGASLVMASAVGCSRRPVEKIVPYLNKPEEITPGVANWYTTTCGECPAGCGMLAKTREGRPIKLEGNPNHPLNQGGLCARGQAGLLNLYDPDRLRAPMRKKEDGSWEAVTWEVADKALQKMKGTVRLLTGQIHSPFAQKLIADFLRKFSDAKQVVYEPLGQDGLVKGGEISYGQSVVPHYHLERAKLIVSFGADFLDTWISPVEFTKQFAKSRNPQDGSMSRLIVVEPFLTLTGSNADLHLPVAAGDEVKVALALAHEIVSVRGLSRFANIAEVANFLAPYAVTTVAQESGLSADILRKIAKELWEQRGKGLVLGGRSLRLQIAVNFLNSLLENDGVTIDANHSPSHQAGASIQNLAVLLEEMRSGKVDVLIIAHSNPLYNLPEESGFAQALKNVGEVIVVADRMDETAGEAHWVLAASHTLESWGDAEPQTGLYSLRQPAIAPLYQTRSLEEILLGWTDGGDALTLASAGQAALQNFWRETIYPKSGFSALFQTFWESSLQRGVLDTRESFTGHSPRSFNLSALAKIDRSTHADLQLVTYPTIPHYDGRSANNGWLMELPDPVTKLTWRNAAVIAPALAKKLGVRSGEVLRLKTATHEAELPCIIQPGTHPEVVAVPLGFGRTKAGDIADGVGINAFQFSPASAVTIEKTGEWIKLATTQQQHELNGRPIVKETTFAEFQKNPHAGNEEEEHLPSIWSEHKYEGHRWGMAIDLNACTGCSACMIACQAENNIAVVGEEQVKKGREMHWIRIDRYYTGGSDNPETLHQPMLCQHCENAPCETVCPVLATVHNEEGLNIQVYNRCVGTRYCSNNCPYKVRRFNWFEYLWKTETPQGLVMNPDVTVREKGVMEKCTFCVQRIQEGKDKAKDLGRKPADGEIKTACQQSCPADAIIFGDMNNPESRVSQFRKNPRGYHVLAELNVKPSITYLTKLRNTDA